MTAVKLLSIQQFPCVVDSHFVPNHWPVSIQPWALHNLLMVETGFEFNRQTFCTNNAEEHKHRVEQYVKLTLEQLK